MKKKLSAVLIAFSITGAAVASEPLRVEFEKANGESVPAYLVQADETNILWKYTPESQSGNRTAREDIKSIDFDDPDEWGEAAAWYNVGNFEKSAEMFGTVADKYKDIMILEGNPASRAKYFQIESLRQLGQYEKIGEQLTAETLALLKKSLDEQFAFQLALDNAWASASAGKWDMVNQIVAEQSLPKVAESTRVPEFKKELPPSQVVQLAYMRGLSAEAAGEKPAALTDFYRTFTLGFGGDINLSGKAMLKALEILVADEELADDRTKLKEVHALAMIYKNGPGSGSIPEASSDYAKPLPPKEGEALPPAPAPAPTPAPESDAPAAAAPAEAGEAAPADAKPEGEAVPKGEEKAKDK